MKNLSIKTINKTIELGRFDFSGFSSSNVWIGYFETKNNYNLELIKEALNLACQFFKEELNSFIIISALKYSVEYDFINEHRFYQKLLSKAKNNSLIQPVNDLFYSYLYGDIPLPASSLTISFDKRNFLYLSKLVMGCDAIIGDVCFFISPKLGIAIYPHEDIGFGVISLNNNRDLGVNFLQYCSRNENFSVYIEKEC